MRQNEKVILFKSIEYSWVVLCSLFTLSTVLSLKLIQSSPLDTNLNHFDINFYNLLFKIIINNLMVVVFISLLSFFKLKLVFKFFLVLSVIQWSYYFSHLVVINLFIDKIHITFYLMTLYSYLEIFSYHLVFFALLFNLKKYIIISIVLLVVAASIEACVICFL